MIRPGEIQSIAANLGLRDTQIEKDYVIGWVLKGIAQSDLLNERLIFKGGTALRKIFFPDYRLSEDLDFTFGSAVLNIIEIKIQFDELIKWVYAESRITLNIQDETLHQTGNYNFYLTYTGPLGGKGENKSIKVDICSDEVVCDKPQLKVVSNEYSDLRDSYKISSYSLSEIISEKMRSLMQRTAPRDLYDLWYMFEVNMVNIEDYIFNFQRKAEYKKLDHAKLVKIISAKEGTFKRQWESQLVNQIKVIPDFDQAWRALGKHWRRFEKFLKNS
ncbi:MAG: hypothetical protein COW85_14240 [Ignavibacteria bacterium CG22_combo_CG10-13_8_21_14_all_37_15]|nr:MAG: hypothetical protein COW85_14240 [Ignavibacteria bacterium CG22_combo_CG10-13_8_21_14_all_37_15]PJC58147.1 MAG: hypothetical protein CO025_09980 [Ignavibacteria bacterium CG_4_9_14_0_2_um_filter_37_13]